MIQDNHTHNSRVTRIFQNTRFFSSGFIGIHPQYLLPSSCRADMTALVKYSQYIIICMLNGISTFSLPSAPSQLFIILIGSVPVFISNWWWVWLRLWWWQQRDQHWWWSSLRKMALSQYKWSKKSKRPSSFFSHENESSFPVHASMCDFF